MNFNFLNLDKKNSSKGSNFLNSFINDLNNRFDSTKNNLTLEGDLYQIDRFEGDDTVFAVCQNLRTKEMINIPKSKLPKEALDCYVLKIENDSYVIDYEETKKYVKDI